MEGAIQMAHQRKPISTRTRFNTFKRDGFVCQYCGRHPPEVVLEVDHIKAVSRGGGAEDYNLITSCFDCNRGKAAGTLEAHPVDLSERADLLKERIAQVAAYDRLLKKQKSAQQNTIDAVCAIFTENFPGWALNSGAARSIRIFLKSLPPDEIEDSMHYACSRVGRDAVFKYFCGVCWRKIKRDGGQ